MRCNTLIILVRLVKCISSMGEEVQILGRVGEICSILFFLVSLKKILLRIAIQLSTC